MLKNRCLSIDELFAWANDRLDASGRETAERHTAACDSCSAKIAQMKRVLATPAPEADPSPRAMAALIKKFGSVGPARGYAQYIWFGLFILFLGLSFCFKRYFVQMLVLAAVCAGKWLLASRTRHVTIEVSGKGKDSDIPARIQKRMGIDRKTSKD